MRAEIGSADDLRLILERSALQVVVGSRAFGLDDRNSDTDVRGVFLAPTSSFWRLHKPPTHLTGPEPEQFSWELERFIVLALRANPGCLEVLWSPLVLEMNAIGRELRELRSAFLSLLVVDSTRGFVRSQLKKIDGDIRRSGAPAPKHHVHLLRVQLSTLQLLRTGSMTLDVGEHREALLRVRRGETPAEEIEDWSRRLDAELTLARTSTPLPDQPDAARVDDWLQSVRARDLLPGGTPI